MSSLSMNVRYASPISQKWNGHLCCHQLAGLGNGLDRRFVVPRLADLVAHAGRLEALDLPFDLGHQRLAGRGAAGDHVVRRRCPAPARAQSDRCRRTSAPYRAKLSTPSRAPAGRRPARTRSPTASTGRRAVRRPGRACRRGSAAGPARPAGRATGGAVVVEPRAAVQQRSPDSRCLSRQRSGHRRPRARPGVRCRVIRSASGIRERAPPASSCGSAWCPRR